MTVVYVSIVDSQGNSPLPWVMGGLMLAAALSAYAGLPAAGLGPAALAVSGFLLIVLGVLGILSIGLPLLVAGIAATVSSRRRLSDL